MKTRKPTIHLRKKEQERLYAILSKGKHNTRVVTRARILLLTDKGTSKDTIASQLEVGSSTVQRVRDRYRDRGLDRALYDAPRPGQPLKIDNGVEAHLVAVACSRPPEGSERWTLELLRKRLIKDKKVKSISTVALWERLKSRGIKPWREKNVVHPEA